MENFTINRDKKTFVLDDGREIPIPEDKVKQVLRSSHGKKVKEQAKQATQKQNKSALLPEELSAFKSSANESFLGNPGATLGEYVRSGVESISPGEGQEGLGYIDRVLDNFYSRQEGRKEAQNELSSRNPVSSGLGTAAGMGAELLALRKLPAGAALPIMGAGHSETSFLEPGKKLPELGKEALTGVLVDKFFGSLGKVAGHRQTRRGVQDAIRQTETGNAAELQRATSATQADAARFAEENTARQSFDAAEKLRANAATEADAARFAEEAGERQSLDAIERFRAGSATEADAARFAEETGARRSFDFAEKSRAQAGTEAEAARFAEETAARETELAGIPGRQQAENNAFIDRSSQEVGRIAKGLGKTAVAEDVIGVENFIKEVMEGSALGASREGNKVTKFLRSIFKGNSEGKLTGESIQKGMRALDETILKESGPVAETLTEFKGNLMQTLPEKIGSYFSYERWAPKFQSRIIPVVENDLANAFKKSAEVNRELELSIGHDYIAQFNKNIRNNINDIFKSHAGNFETALADGTITREIQLAIEENSTYQNLLDKLSVIKGGGINIPQHLLKQGFNKNYKLPHPPAKGFEEVYESVINYPNSVGEKIASISDKYLPDVLLDANKLSSKTQKTLQNLEGRPNLVPEPPPVNAAQTVQPNLMQGPIRPAQTVEPNLIQGPIKPAQTVQPNLMQGPIRPAQPVEPNLQPVPEIPEPQGLMQRLAYGLENMNESGIGGAINTAKESLPAGILAKVAGVPVGKLIAGGAALSSGVNALTSPGAAGQLARGVLQQSAIAIQSAQQRAERYPSHRGMGILENPMERRSLVREIEDDYNMKIEDKAIIQSKINRGQPLTQ